MQALVKGGSVVKFPYSEAALRADNRNVSFPEPIPAAMLADWGVVPVEEAGLPPVQDGEVAVPRGTPELVGGKWVLGWDVRAKTADEIAADKDRARLECRRRILAVADETAQINMLAAYAAGKLTTDDAATFEAGVQWILDMRAAWPDVTDPSDDSQWPAVPAGAAELAAKY